MRLSRIAALWIFSALVSTGPALAGGSVGGGTGLILDLKDFVLTQTQFESLAVCGILGEKVIFNGKPAKVKTMDFLEKTVELEVKDLGYPAVLHQTETPPEAKE